MKNLNQATAIYFKNNLVSFIDWDSEYRIETLSGWETRIIIFVGTALLNVNLNELSN